MSKNIEYTAVIESVTRVGTSTNGNPSYLIHFEGGATARTQTDSAVAYEINNPEFKGVPVKVSATAAGRVWGVEIVQSDA